MTHSNSVPVPLSSETRRRLDLLFPQEQREAAAALLEAECGNNLPFLGDADPVRLERLRFAALKISDGQLDRLAHAVRIAKQDWRDLLVWSGFACDIQAHQRWLAQDEDLRS